MQHEHCSAMPVDPKWCGAGPRESKPGAHGLAADGSSVGMPALESESSSVGDQEHVEDGPHEEEDGVGRARLHLVKVVLPRTAAVGAVSRPSLLARPLVELAGQQRSQHPTHLFELTMDPARPRPGAVTRVRREGNRQPTSELQAPTYWNRLATRVPPRECVSVRKGSLAPA
jgi:hypothetical protein